MPQAQSYCRGDLAASEPIAGQYRIDFAEYERWRQTPTRASERQDPPTAIVRARRSRGGVGLSDRLRAIERTG